MAKKKKTVKKKPAKKTPKRTSIQEDPRDWYLDSGKRPNYIKLVKDFHVAFGHPAPKSALAAKLTGKVKALRVALHMEECIETIHALTHKNEVDFIELADGLSDLIYVVAGTAVVAGLTNQRYDIYPFKHYKDEKLQFTMAVFIGSTVHQFNNLIENEATTEWMEYIKNVIGGAESIAIAYNIPLWECFREVQKSNMSKLGADGKPMYHTTGPKKGKIKKGPNFKEPNLKKILKKHGTIK